MRIIRGTKIAKGAAKVLREKETPENGSSQDTAAQSPATKASEIGDSIFSSNFTPTAASGQNPFAKYNPPEREPRLNDHYHRPLANPFAPNSRPGPYNLYGPPLTPQPPPISEANALPTLFSEKARITSEASSHISSGQGVPTPSPPSDLTPLNPGTKVPWPEESQLPAPYPAYHLDADYETLDPAPAPSVKTSGNMEIDSEDSKNDVFDKEAFESSLDKTFQKFADRLAQNPEQVLRYEYGGSPLLYSTTDAVGNLFSIPHHGEGKVKTTGATAKGIPKCGNCGSKRVFEVQLVPQAIAELEVEEEGLEGMEWGTVIVGVCGLDCGEKGVEANAWGWVEEWVGVQWEEVAKPGKA